jgi:hypothetical protein
MRLGALAVLPLVLLAAACTHGPYAPGGGMASPQLAHLRRGGIAFEYPAAWRYHRRGFLATMTEGLVDLSTQPMVNPCRRRGSSTRCGWPVRRLRPAGVVVVWDLFGGGPALMHPPPVGARVRRIRDGSCRAIGGAEALQGTVVTRRRHQIYDAFACIAAGHRTGNAAAFAAMVRSARPA